MKQHLTENRDAILESWFERVLESYPTETGKYLGRKTNAFANPVGAALRECLAGILDFLIEGGEIAELDRHVEQFVKVRAVQEFTPAGGMAWVFLLKNVLRERLDGRLGDPGTVRALLDFESNVDGVALICFGHYAEAREKLHQIAAASNYRQTHVLVERMNKMSAERMKARGLPVEDEPPTAEPVAGDEEIEN